MSKLGAFVLSGILLTALNAASLEQVKRLKYAEQTEQNVKHYKEILESLSKRNSAQAQFMLGEAYETGSHWPADMAQALHYYGEAAVNGSDKARIKLGYYYAQHDDFNRSKSFYRQALDAGRIDAIKPLLTIALGERDAASIQEYAKLAKQHNLALDDSMKGQIKKAVETTSEAVSKTIWEAVEDTTFDATKVYIKATMQTLISLEAAYKNMGFAVEEYLIYNGLEPTIEIILERKENQKIDEEMAFFIAGSNALKKAIVGMLVWANKMGDFLEQDLGYTVLGLEIEVGSSATAKLKTGKPES